MRTVTVTVEWWPEHGLGPLWVHGSSIEPASILPQDLAECVLAWNDAFVDDDMLPVDGPGDSAWLAEGKALLTSVREAAPATHEIIATEPWWGEEPIDPARP